LNSHKLSPFAFIITNYLTIVKILLVFSPIYLSALTKEEKVEKLFILPKPLENRQIGGIISADLQAADNQLLVMDAEWGVGMRRKEVEDLPRNLTLGAIEDMELLEAFGLEVARQCRQRGIQSALAPVVDVNNNPLNPIIGIRSFGDDPEEVAKRGLAVMRGMSQGGIWGCVKHFPGHGDTHIDSHLALPRMDKSLEEIRALELVPFRALIEEGVDMVMVGHMLFPALDDLPSSLSWNVMTKLLREELGFEGVVITDSLSMGALSSFYAPDEIAERALLAGADLLLYNGCSDEWLEEWIPKAIERITRNVSDEIIKDRLARVERLSKEVKILPKEDPLLRKKLYQAAVTRVGQERILSREVALVQKEPDPVFADLLRRYAKVTCFSFEEIDLVSEHADLIVQVGPEDSIPKSPSHAILAVFTAPYWISGDAMVGYEDAYLAKEAVADALFGKIPALGKLPIRVYEYGYESRE